MSERETNLSPQFSLDAQGKSTNVTLDVNDYVKLLVEANVTDPSQWPPRFQEGATTLGRIREIEAECIASHGEFDWEMLPSAIQDEYDSLCASLDSMLEKEDMVNWESYPAERQDKD